MLYLRLLVWVSVVLSLPQGRCVCFFPGELQGVWHTQVTGHIGDGRRVTRSPITYQELTIHSDTILQWGSCHQRLDDYILLTDRSGSTLCYRCIQLEVVTPQVVQVWSTGLQTCYTTEAAALRTCPTPAHLAAHTAAHLMLYKSKTTWGEDAITTVDCPLNGRFTFTYQVGDARRGKTGLENSCDQPTSEFSNCPHGFGFSITYRDCTFPTPRNGSLQCLGSWVGHDRHNYLAVLDSSVKIGSYVPRYKCGMFREEAGTGRVFVAFSEDSTCTNGLYSPTDGYETYVLTSVPPPPLPPDVTSSSCTFPRSLRGHWHHTYVADDTVVFKDYHNYRTYTARCVRDLDDGEHYIVFTRTHCGEWNYNCLWLKRRSANVLEFMLGLYPRETFDTNLCEPDKFGDMTSWTTQGKSLLEEPTTCPIVGNYAGVLPDAPGYCAQLYSDCETPQLMYYTVSDCRNTTYVYEQREYQCLGQWEEEGRVYALTYRRDIHTYECFVGLIRTGGVVFIKEAGARCSRGIQPEVLGMKLYRKESCAVEDLTSEVNQSSQRSPERSSATRPPWLRTTKPWKPITARPGHRGSGCKGLFASHHHCIFTLIVALIASTLNII
ncbi:hypothetical protein OTU49_015204 [Cherax quadricarinatus]|uniref:Uncharacterized protein n=1 Tax=Cherax quadricarinatus TaxID=27406 RepID=A0AAW0YEA7_CHEQU